MLTDVFISGIACKLINTPRAIVHWLLYKPCQGKSKSIGRANLARENEAEGSWGQEVHLLHVNI